MNASVLQLLLAGEYLCNVRYPNEYKALEPEAARDQVNAWLRHINMRLARIGASGAWFMTADMVTDRIATKFKGEMRDFRDVYGPAVRMLDFIRQTNPENPHCSPGERIQLVELEQLVYGSTTLSAQLRALIDVIHNGNSRVTDRENLRRLLEHLRKDGYVQLVDAGTESYVVTGKIEQLYAVLTFLDENKAIEEGDADDQLDLTDGVEGELRMEP
jgi:hypothetical protein